MVNYEIAFGIFISIICDEWVTNSSTTYISFFFFFFFFTYFRNIQWKMVIKTKVVDTCRKCYSSLTVDHLYENCCEKRVTSTVLWNLNNMPRIFWRTPIWRLWSLNFEGDSSIDNIIQANWDFFSFLLWILDFLSCCC